VQENLIWQLPDCQMLIWQLPDANWQLPDAIWQMPDSLANARLLWNI